MPEQKLDVRFAYFSLGFIVGIALILTLLLITTYFPTPLLGGLLSLFMTSLDVGDKVSTQGEVIQVFGTTRCAPNAVIAVDGTPLSNVSVQNGEFTSFIPTGDIDVGIHNLSMSAGVCSRTIQIQLLGQPCTVEGVLSPCTLKNGCPGTRVCISKAFTACSPVGKVCEPGNTRGCTLPNKCGAGSQSCNSCGTNWTECLG